MLFKKNKLPVDTFDKELIEKSLLWFENKLGADFIRSKEYIIPAKCNFKYQKAESEEAIRYFIDYICNYIQLDPGLIEYKIMMNDKISFSEGLVSREDERVRYTSFFDLMADGKYRLAVYSNSMKDFDLAFLKLSYQLICIKLFSEGIFTFVNGYMINFAMVIFGFGLLCANGMIYSQQWQGIAYYGWKVRSFGFINHRMYGYILALLAEYRKEDWSAYLCADTLKYFTQSTAFIKEQNEKTFLLSSHPDSEVKDEEVFVQKTFYENGMIRIISHFSNGKYSGRMIFYHQNGKLWSERIYKNGVSYNVLTNYNSYGDAVEKGTLKNGNGTLYIYNPDGSLLHIEEYRDGQKISEV